MDSTFHRRSIRLDGFDYSQGGAFFVTICTYQRRMVFGEIQDSDMTLNPCGKIAHEEWVKSRSLRPGIALDMFVLMPNHIHGIVVLAGSEVACGRGAPLCAPTHENKSNFVRRVDSSHQSVLIRKPRSLGSFIAGYKMKVCMRINELCRTDGAPVWQRNYHERIIRNNKELEVFREYIHANPARWELDSLHPSKVR